MSLIVQKDVGKKARVPGKMPMAPMDVQEPLGKVVCWIHFVTIYLDVDASSFSFFKGVLTYIPMQRSEHSHFNLFIFQKEALCPPYSQTIEIIGKMFLIDNHSGNKENPP